MMMAVSFLNAPPGFVMSVEKKRCSKSSYERKGANACSLKILRQKGAKNKKFHPTSHIREAINK
jgi:hypothetical protein